MAEKDLTEKILEDYNDVFADIVNGLIFQGKSVVKEEDLYQGGVHSQYKAEDSKLHELERDIQKHWSQGEIEFAMIGLENQTEAEELMPFRVFGYDGAGYRSQLLKKVDKVVPVITMVLYFGTKTRWNKAKNIKSLMKIPPGLEEYVNDFKIQVFEIAWLSEEEISRFKSDFKVVANFFVNKRKNKNYIPNDPTEIKHVDEVLKLLAVMSGDRRYEELLWQPENRGGVRNMCDVAQRLIDSGIEKGIEQGIERERADVIQRMLLDRLPYEKIMQYTGASVEEIQKNEETLAIK